MEVKVVNSSPDTNLINGLRALCGTNEAAARLFEVFSSRKYDSRETTVARAAAKAGADYSTMLSVFRELGNLGAGRFVQGRHGYPSRIEWKFSIRSLGAVAKGEKAAPDQVSADAVEDEADEEEREGVLTHEFQLRDGLKAQFNLPANLTEKEADRLSLFIKSLPF